jgi:hypothetical protein
MKKIPKHILSLVLLSMFISINSDASIIHEHDSSNPTKEHIANIVNSSASSMEMRLLEIKNMDKSLLSSSEKKNLRQEVRAINNAREKNTSGVYLSVGAVVIILLLLIILL